MKSYRRFILPIVLIGSAAVASIFAALMAERLRNKERQKAALDGWEDEGGSVAVVAAAAPESSSINTETGVRGNVVMS